jgi:hypothetical protein
MSNDLGVWKAEDCALLLIDYQKEMFEVIRSETSADLVETSRSSSQRSAFRPALISQRFRRSSVSSTA